MISGSRSSNFQQSRYHRYLWGGDRSPKPIGHISRIVPTDLTPQESIPRSHQLSDHAPSLLLSSPRARGKIPQRHDRPVLGVPDLPLQYARPTTSIHFFLRSIRCTKTVPALSQNGIFSPPSSPIGQLFHYGGVRIHCAPPFRYRSSSSHDPASLGYGSLRRFKLTTYTTGSTNPPPSLVMTEANLMRQR
jgi:hypothetical protein